MAGFLVVGVVGVLCLVRDQRGNSTGALGWDRYVAWCAAALVLLLVYCLLAPLGVEIKGRLFENAASQTDWSIRIQLINACLRGGVRPASPMFAFQGHTAPLHTYFYWYELCAQVALLTGIGAQSALTASCLGAALAQVAALLLMLHYVPISRRPLRRQAVMLGLAMCVTGLDVWVFVFDLVHHRFRPDPQLALMDHAPGFLYNIVWSPHHVAGTALCLTGLLLVVIATGITRRQALVHAVLAAVCYAAAAGTSTFITAIFLLVCTFVLVEAVRKKDWRQVETIAVAGVLAVVLTLPLLEGMRAASVGTPPNAGAPIHVRTRYAYQALQIAFHYYFQYHVDQPKIYKLWFELMRLGLLLFFCVVDLGLILYVAWDRVRLDWPRRAELRPAERLLWAIFVIAAIPCLMLTSATPTHSANDAGFHAATVMRVVAVLWAVPLMFRYRETAKPRSRWQRLGMFLFVSGLLSQAVQLVENRFQIPLVDRGWVAALPVGERVPNVGLRFDEIREAMDAAARYTPADGVVAIYPHSRLGSALLMYTHRQLAASDEGCNLPFGGSDLECRRMVVDFNNLFGGNPYYQGEQIVPPHAKYNPADTTVSAFEFICRDNRLSAVVADYTSPAWQHPDTWVWALHPVYANSAARVFLCPQNGQG